MTGGRAPAEGEQRSGPDTGFSRLRKLRRTVARVARGAALGGAALYASVGGSEGNVPRRITVDPNRPAAITQNTGGGEQIAEHGTPTLAAAGPDPHGGKGSIFPNDRSRHQARPMMMSRGPDTQAIQESRSPQWTQTREGKDRASKGNGGDRIPEQFREAIENTRQVIADVTVDLGRSEFASIMSAVFQGRLACNPIPTPEGNRTTPTPQVSIDQGHSDPAIKVSYQPNGQVEFANQRFTEQFNVLLRNTAQRISQQLGKDPRGFLISTIIDNQLFTDLQSNRPAHILVTEASTGKKYMLAAYGKDQSGVDQSRFVRMPDNGQWRVDIPRPTYIVATKKTLADGTPLYAAFSPELGMFLDVSNMSDLNRDLGPDINAHAQAFRDFAVAQLNAVDDRKNPDTIPTLLPSIIATADGSGRVVYAIKINKPGTADIYGVTNSRGEVVGVQAPPQNMRIGGLDSQGRVNYQVQGKDGQWYDVAYFDPDGNGGKGKIVNLTSAEPTATTTATPSATATETSTPTPTATATATATATSTPTNTATVTTGSPTIVKPTPIIIKDTPTPPNISNINLIENGGNGKISMVGAWTSDEVAQFQTRLNWIQSNDSLFYPNIFGYHLFAKGATSPYVTGICYGIICTGLSTIDGTFDALLSPDPNAVLNWAGPDSVYSGIATDMLFNHEYGAYLYYNNVNVKNNFKGFPNSTGAKINQMQVACALLSLDRLSLRLGLKPDDANIEILANGQLQYIGLPDGSWRGYLPSLKADPGVSLTGLNGY